MADNQKLILEIKANAENLTKGIDKASSDISKFSKATEAQGKVTGKAFGTNISNGTSEGISKLAESFTGLKDASTQGFSGIASNFSSLVLNPITLSIAAIGASIAAAFSLAKIGEENQRIANTFKTFASDAGLDADRMVERIAKVADGYADLEDVLPRAGEAISALGKNASRVPEIFELAKKIGVQTGRDILEVFNDLAKGIENQNVKLLRNNLIRLDGTKILADYAAAHKTTVDRLTEAAKQQAFLNATLEQGKTKFGENTKEAAPLAHGIKAVSLAFDDLKDAAAAVANSSLGTGFASLLNGAASAVKSFANTLTPESFKTVPEIEGRLGELNIELARHENYLNRLAGNPIGNIFGAGDEAAKKIESIKTEMRSLNDELVNLKTPKEESKPPELTQSDIVQETDAQKQERLQKIADFNAEKERLMAESRAIELQSDSDLKIQQALLDAEGNAQAQSVIDARLAAEYQKNQSIYEMDVARAQKIKDANLKEMALQNAAAKQVQADIKVMNQAEIDDEKRKASAKQAIGDQLLNIGKSFAKEGSDFAKALAVADAVRSTYAAANLALASAPPPYSFVLAGVTVAAGLANVAKITGANNGALVTGGQTGIDSQPYLLSKGEIVAPAKSFDEVIEGTAKERGYSKSGDDTNALLRELIGKIGNGGTNITINTDVVADENGMNKLAEKLRDAIEFNSAPSLARS